ncbi:MAG: hypothetical protein Q7T00_06245, partial [Rugosibacter sp.]|nr:hypothetical protein [Rugosibacter sp.]
PKLLDQMRGKIRLKHYSLRIEQIGLNDLFVILARPRIDHAATCGFESDRRECLNPLLGRAASEKSALVVRRVANPLGGWRKKGLRFEGLWFARTS